MPNLAKAIGILLTLLGLLSFLLSSGASWTALIPACIGIPLYLLGVFARNEKARKHLMHTAVILALVGFLGSVPGLLSLPALFGGEVSGLSGDEIHDIFAEVPSSEIARAGMTFPMAGIFRV